jgi:hypothetical protein
MFVKEWTVDERGHLRMTWVKQERISPLTYVATIETTAKAAEATRRAPADAPIQNSNGSSKSGKWNWIHTAFHCFLP